jgi:hypothetical protein
MATFDRATRTIGDILKLRAESGSVAAFEAIAEAAEAISHALMEDAMALPRKSPERHALVQEAHAWTDLAELADEALEEEEPTGQE